MLTEKVVATVLGLLYAFFSHHAPVLPSNMVNKLGECAVVYQCTECTETFSNIFGLPLHKALELDSIQETQKECTNTLHEITDWLLALEEGKYVTGNGIVSVDETLSVIATAHNIYIGRIKSIQTQQYKLKLLVHPYVQLSALQAAGLAIAALVLPVLIILTRSLVLAAIVLAAAILYLTGMNVWYSGEQTQTGTTRIVFQIKGPSTSSTFELVPPQ